MPIFAYRCESCGFEKDVLQKRSDPPLVTCPACSRESFVKQLAAPAFQLKGSGWYVTDFRDNKGAAKPETPVAANAESAQGGSDAGAAKAAPEGAAPAAATPPAAGSGAPAGQPG